MPPPRNKRPPQRKPTTLPRSTPRPAPTTSAAPSAPPRNLTLTTDPCHTALKHLINVPGFGDAWNALPASATHQQQFLAHERDLDLIYAPGRTTNLLPTAEERLYSRLNSDEQVASDAANYETLLETQERLHFQLSEEFVGGMRQGQERDMLLGRWKILAPESRERIVVDVTELFAHEDPDRPDGNWLWMLLAPEISIKGLTGGNGQGFVDLVNLAIPRKLAAVNRLYSVPNPTYDALFQVGSCAPVDVVPRSRAVRRFQEGMLHMRYSYIHFIITHVFAELDGSEVYTRPEEPLPKARLDQQLDMLARLLVKMERTRNSSLSNTVLHQNHLGDSWMI